MGCLVGIGGLGWASRTRWADEYVLIDVGLSAIAGESILFLPFVLPRSTFSSGLRGEEGY